MTPEQEQPRSEDERRIEQAMPAEASQSEQPEQVRENSLEATVDKLKQLALSQGPESALAKEMTPLIEQLEALISLERHKVVLEAIAATAHEISQPLTVILGSAERVEVELPPDSPQLLYAQRIIKSTKIIERILTKMRNFQRYVTTEYAGDISMIDFDAAAAPPRVDKS